MKRVVIFLIILFAAMIIALNAMVVTEANEYKMIQQFGKIVTVYSEPGLKFKLPFVQSVRQVPKMVLIYDLPISDVITKDKKTMVADSFVLWRVTDPVIFLQTLNGNVSNAEARISTIVYNSMKNVISSLTQTEIISGRDKLANAIFQNIGEGMHQYGIELVAVETKHLDLPDENKQAVYARMISERNNIAASYTAQGESEAKQIKTQTDTEITVRISQANAEAEKLMAEGESRYMQILAEAYADPEKADFYSFVRSLDAVSAAMVGNNKTLILTKDSPIAEIFYGAG
ncbi:MAG: protease modulator HflC [Oscillospiraceae bacterium]|nr:protease modulator HflC [Oscillospiraceae bacterium]MCI9363138.1 protease modulator HflC [Oscillospiraceae bacterium]MCI9668281.1 protease modulator HflC [Oscillospiraceae bacterium]RKJ58740.1 protease modulator HflC [bacterium 1XD42-8]RKJ67719.1 protease modulator HflC [bacterium 1XD42-1]